MIILEVKVFNPYYYNYFPVLYVDNIEQGYYITGSTSVYLCFLIVFNMEVDNGLNTLQPEVDRHILVWRVDSI